MKNASIWPRLRRGTRARRACSLPRARRISFMLLLTARRAREEMRCCGKSVRGSGGRKSECGGARELISAGGWRAALSSKAAVSAGLWAGRYGTHC